MKLFKSRKKRPLSADVIALLAQAHSIHQAELEFARDEVRTELRDKVRKALESMSFMDDAQGNCRASSAEVHDRYLFNIGSLFAETPEQHTEWSQYVRERAVARNDAKFAIISQQIDRAKKRGNAVPVPFQYQEGENGTHASGGVVATW
jgi:hypothetical protein